MTQTKQFYFDYAATTPVDQRVVAAMEPYWYRIYGNPSSLHRLGREAKNVLLEKKTELAAFFGVASDQLVLTSGGTESDNMAILGMAGASTKPGQIIISAIEHKAVQAPALSLRRLGWRVDVCPVDDQGLLKPTELKKLVSEETVLVSVIYANNEIGVVQDLPAIAKLVKNINPETLVHTDANQALNYLPIEISELGVDLLSFGASKIYGPKGIGGLVVKKGVRLQPIIYGGGQEKGWRSGTENLAGLVGMVEALKISRRTMKAENERLLFLRQKLVSGILKAIPESVLNGHPTKRLVNNVNVSLSRVEGETLVLYLDNIGIYASTGSACSASDLDPSHVLLALGQEKGLAHGSLRLTLGRWTSEEGVDYLLSKLPPIVAKVREMSAL